MVLNKQEVDAKTAEVVQDENHEGAPPVGFEVIRREFAKDKIAMGALIILLVIVLGVIFASFFIDLDKATTVNIFNRFTKKSIPNISRNNIDKAYREPSSNL